MKIYENAVGQLVLEIVELLGPATTSTIVEEVTARRPVTPGAVRRALHRYADRGLLVRCGRIPIMRVTESRAGRLPLHQTLWRVP